MLPRSARKGEITIRCSPDDGEDGCLRRDVRRLGAAFRSGRPFRAEIIDQLCLGKVLRRNQRHFSINPKPWQRLEDGSLNSRDDVLEKEPQSDGRAIFEGERAGREPGLPQLSQVGSKVSLPKAPSQDLLTPRNGTRKGERGATRLRSRPRGQAKQVPSGPIRIALYSSA